METPPIYPVTLDHSEWVLLMAIRSLNEHHRAITLTTLNSLLSGFLALEHTGKALPFMMPVLRRRPRKKRASSAAKEE